MRGIDLLRKVRESDAYADTPFFLITAAGAQEQIIEAVQAGVSNYIVHPFTADTLKIKIDTLFP